MKRWVKDPGALLDYGFDWSSWLGTDTLATSTWAAEDGLTVDSQGFTATMAVVWLKGGTAGQSYIVTNHIVTATGRTDERSFVIDVRER